MCGPDPTALGNSVFLDLEHPITVYEAIKLVLLFPLALVRLLAILVIFVGVWLPCRVYVTWTRGCSCCGRAPDSDSGTEKATFESRSLGNAFIDWWIKVGSRCLLFAAGWLYIKVKGTQHVSPNKQTTIFVYNHITFADPVVLLAILGGHSGVAKASVAELPFVGAISRAMYYIFIQRRNSVQDQHASHRFAVNNDRETTVGTVTPQGALTQRVENHPDRVLVVAPEGTTKGRECLLRFRKGAFVPGVAVTPVLLRYPASHFYPGWGVPYNDFFHIWRLLSQVINYVEVEFLEPYVPDEEEQKDATLYAERVRETMARHLGVGLVDTDVREENELRRMGIRPNFLGTELDRR